MRGARRLLGSVPNNVAHQAHCDVLVVDTVDVRFENRAAMTTR